MMTTEVPLDGPLFAPVLHLRGEIDLATAASVRGRIRDFAARQPGPEITIDLSQVEFIDSTGVAVFVEAYRDLLKEGRRLVLAEPAPQARRLLRVLGLDRIFCRA